jgi:hypothetical protein
MIKGLFCYAAPLLLFDNQFMKSLLVPFADFKFVSQHLKQWVFFYFFYDVGL